MSTAEETENGFFTFYREYAHTAVHTVTATALTAFGLLTFVHQGFVVLAIAVYVLPPIYLYLTRNGEPPEPVGTEITEETNEASEPTDTASGDFDGQSAESIESTDSTKPEATETASPTSGDRKPPTDGTARSGEPTAEPSVAESPSGATVSNSGDGEETTATETAARTTTERERTASAGSGNRTEADRTDRQEDEDGKERKDDRSDGDNEPNEIEDSEGSEAPEPVETSESIEEFEDTEETGDSEGTGENVDTGETDGSTEEWDEIDSPTSETLFDVVAVGKNAYAAGENGVVLAREDEWEIVLDHGPAAESETLRGVDATRDGNALWVTGDSGVLGRYDPEAGRHTDHSAPEGITDNWTDLAVAGAAGEEQVHLVNGSGQVLVGSYDGSAVKWEEPVKPGSGSSMSAIEFVDESTGYCCDTNSGVYEISDEEFERIGIEDGGSFTALAATDETIGVTDDDGTVQRFDGAIWTPLRTAENALSAIDTNDGEWIAVGTGGIISEQQGGGWESVDSATEANLHGIAIGATPVAVGDEGTLLERSES